jgi:hypothetical protein
VTRYRLGITVAVWTVLVGALLASDSQPHAVVLAGIVGVIAAVGFVAFDLIRATTAVAWARAPLPLPLSVDDEAVSFLAHQIRAAHRSPSTMLRDTLVDLVDDRLLDHHGLDRAGQPAATSAALSPMLMRLADQRSIRLSSVTELNALLTEIESI